MAFKPLHDNILVEREIVQEVSKGGIILPNSAQEIPLQGKVISVGTGHRNSNGLISKLHVNENDIVLFGKWAGTQVKLDGKDYLILKEQEILGIIG